MATTDIRPAFVQQFLYTVEGLDPYEKTLEELVELFDMELARAGTRWPSLNIAAEWARMDAWLSDRGVTA